MAYFNEKFKRARLDQSPYLFHFVNGRDKKPGETLLKILEEQKLRSDIGYICFSASPITAIKKFFETKTNSTGNPLYHPFGIGFSRDVLVRDFRARNVIYTDGTENIPDCLQWRTEKLEPLMLEVIRQSQFTNNDATRLLVRSRETPEDPLKYTIEYVQAALSLEKKLCVMLYDEGTRDHMLQEEKIFKDSKPSLDG